MGSEGSHNTQNDTPLAPSSKQRKKEGKRVALQAKVDELEAQNNKIAMKNEVLQKQYEKLFETLHEIMRIQTRELVAPVDINHHLGAPQHGGSPSLDMGILDDERANHQNIDQHEISLNPAASTRNRRSGGRHLIAEGLEGSKAFIINDPRVSERLGPLPRPKPAANLGKERHVLEEHEGTWDSEVFRQTCPRSQYDKSKEISHALAQTFLLLRGDGDLRKKILVVHDSTQDPLVLQLIEEVNKLKAEIPDWNQPRPGHLTRKILDTPFKRRQNKNLVYNSILEEMTQLNTLTSLSPPWHIGCTPMKSDVFSSPPPSLVEL
ncbi:hypothetical protein FF1_027441 [Malus domestica]